MPTQLPSFPVSQRAAGADSQLLQSRGRAGPCLPCVDMLTVQGAWYVPTFTFCVSTKWQKLKESLQGGVSTAGMCAVTATVLSL